MKKIIKYFMIFVIALIAIGVVGAALGLGDEEVTNEGTTQVTTEPKQSTVDENALTEENISNAIIDVIGDKSKEDKQRVIKIEVNENNQVVAHLNADSSLTAESTVYTSNDLLAELQKFEDATRVELMWYATMIDDKGNESEGRIVDIAFNKETLDTINFENFPIESYSKYADVYYVHPGWAF